MAYMNKIYRFIENASKMTFLEKKDILYKNNIVIIRNLEIKFHDENCYNYNIAFICILQSYISSMYEALVFSRQTILKLFEFSGFQTKIFFKQSFKY